MAKVGVIIQARMGSTRLPGKVMLDLHGKTILAHVVERCKRVDSAEELVIATTDKPSDDIIEEEAQSLGVYCYRGSESDVLSRYYGAALSRNIDIIVRITSDCPLIDPLVTDSVIQSFLKDPQLDYCTNTITRTYPRGLDVEVFSFQALQKAHLNASKPYEREHVTPYIYQNNTFSIKSVTDDADHSIYRWTLDTTEDWTLIKEIYDRLYREGQIIDYKEALELLEQYPELHLINAHVEQKKLAD